MATLTSLDLTALCLVRASAFKVIGIPSGPVCFMR